MPAPKKKLAITDKQMAKLHAAGQPWTEIARNAGCSVSTVKSRVAAVKAAKA